MKYHFATPPWIGLLLEHPSVASVPCRGFAPQRRLSIRRSIASERPAFVSGLSGRAARWGPFSAASGDADALGSDASRCARSAVGNTSTAGGVAGTSFAVPGDPDSFDRAAAGGGAGAA